MPDQIAHTLFARRVLEAADAGLRARILPDSPAFRAGCFGPDPLFNDPNARRRAEGFEMHRKSGREAMERMRKPIQEKMPWAVDYAAGFFCHYALDRLCHPEIKAMAARGEIKHLALETAYDRVLYQRGFQDLPRHISMCKGALEAAVQMYTRIRPGQYRFDLEAFWQIRRLLIYSGGTFLSALPGKFNARLEGMIPPKENTPGIERGIAMLDEKMEASILPTAEQLKRYFLAIDENLPLDDWLNADFSGMET